MTASLHIHLDFISFALGYGVALLTCALAITLGTYLGREK